MTIRCDPKSRLSSLTQKRADFAPRRHATRRCQLSGTQGGAADMDRKRFFAAGTAAAFLLGGLYLAGADDRSEEHTSELQSLMRISYAVFCLKKKKKQYTTTTCTPRYTYTLSQIHQHIHKNT